MNARIQVSVFQTEAVLNVCGIESPLSLDVHYTWHRGIAGNSVSPEEPAGVEIQSIYRNGRAIDDKLFSEAQLDAMANEILQNQ